MTSKKTSQSIPKALAFFKGRFYLNFATYLFRRLFIGAIFFILLFHLFTNRELGTDYLGSLSTLYTVKENLPFTIIITGGVVMMFIGISVFFLTLVNSNKIAGPFYRLERDFEEIEKGDLSIVVRFRKDDAINLIVDDSNMALDKLNHAFSGVSDASSRLKEMLEAAKANPEDASLEEIKNLIAKLKDANSQLEIKEMSSNVQPVCEI